MVAILFSSPGSVLAEDMDNEPNRPASSIRFFTAEGVFPNVMGMIANQAGAQGQAIPTALLLEFEDFTLMLFRAQSWTTPVPPPEWWWIIHLHICTGHWG